jgi:hypothetical protein
VRGEGRRGIGLTLIVSFLLLGAPRGAPARSGEDQSLGGGASADLLIERPRRFKRAWTAPRGLREGVVIARLRVKAGGSGELRVRAGAGVSLAVTVRRQSMSLARVDRSGRKLLVGPRHLRRFRRQEEVDLRVWLLGRHTMVVLRDPRSGAVLGEMAASVDPGGEGVVLGGGARWSRLSLQGACDPTLPAGKGPMVVARVAAEKIPEGAGEVLDRPSEPSPQLVVRSTPAGLAAISCAGASIEQVSVDFPFKYVDPAYLEARRRSPKAISTGLKNPAMVEALLAQWQRQHPGRVHLEELGRSHQGRPILGLALAAGEGDPDERPQVLMAAAHHGEEPFSAEIVLDAARWLLSGDPLAEAWLKKTRVWCVPLVNPDGLHYFMEVSRRGGRKNGRDLDGDGERGPEEGVDLNRNYPFRWAALGQRGSRSRGSARLYRGPEPASEPEVRAMMALAERERFTAAISFHTGAVAVLVPYTVSGVRSPRRDEARVVAEAMVAGLPEHPHGRPWRVMRRLYPVDGTDQDWLRHAHGTVAFLVEAGRWSPVESSEREAALAAVRPLWRRLIGRVASGPGLAVRVVDAEDKPVEARVTVRELRGRAGERWTSRPGDGRYYRLLPEPGTYTVVVRPKSGRSIRRRVHVGQGWREEDVRF